MKIYCQKCGFGASYSSDKPKFCSSCGHAHFPALKTRGSLPHKITQEDEDQGLTTERVPNISSLEVEIDTRSDRSTKLKNLLGTSNGLNYPQENQAAHLSKAEFEESFRKEAGFYPSRRSTDETPD